MTKHELKGRDAATVIYGEGGEMPVPSYAHARALKMTGMERNHMIPKVFFEKGPEETAHLAGHVPIMPLTQEEHRGARYSFHHMKDGTRVTPGSGRGFNGCGLDGYLRSRGLRVGGVPFYTAEQVSKAIQVCQEYHAMIGLDWAAAAIQSFRDRFYDPAAAARTKL